MTKKFRLPDYTWTDDVDKFSDEWDKIRKPLENMGFRVIGFDPGITLCNAENDQGSFTLPTYAAKRFIERMKC